MSDVASFFDGAAYADLVLEWLAALGINETLTGTPTYRLLRGRELEMLLRGVGEEG